MDESMNFKLKALPPKSRLVLKLRDKEHIDMCKDVEAQSCVTTAKSVSPC